MEEIILASTSPRREEIFLQMRLPFRSIAPECDEDFVSLTNQGDPEVLVMKLAHLKGKSVYSRVKNEGPDWIAGFDTLVALDEHIVGKARSGEEAFQMLSLLSGKVHRVYTGIALYQGRRDIWDIRSEKSEVKFAQLGPEEIEFYLSTGEWKGVAGSYRIQERGSFFIEWIKGSYSNIVGLPISLFYVMLKHNNYSFS
ncbi:MAG: septum formation protein Maf [Spirochaetales bacterium]|nr:septum formation protein Maf [Spirochaetales bacterium]